MLYLLLLEKVWAVHGLASLGHRNRCAFPSWTLPAPSKRSALTFLACSRPASGIDVVPHRRRDRSRMGCRCNPGDREPFRCVLPRNQSHPEVSLAAWTHRRDPERDLLYRPQAFHNDSAPHRRHSRQSLPLAGFPPADLAKQVAANSQASSSREYCRLDLSRNLLVSSFSKLGSSHSPSHRNGPDAQQQRLHHHHPRRQGVELDLPRQLLDRHLYQRPRRLCSHRISGSDRPEWSALPRRTTPTMARPPLADEADRKTRPLLD